MTQKERLTDKYWVWGGIDKRKAAGHCRERDRLDGFGEEYLIILTYLMMYLLFLPKIYVDSI